MQDLLPLGIHFGLSDEAHHADPALGSSHLKAIRANAVDWQFDRLYGEEKDPSPALVWGSAFHAWTLEGQDAFNRRFRTAPSKADFAGQVLLDSAADLKGYLAEHTVSTRGATRKEQYIELIRQFDKEVLIWEEIIGAFKSAIDAGNIVAIDQRTRTQIEMAVSWLQAHSKTGSGMRDGTFFGGAPEVTIIYEYRDVRLKARFDYLYPTLALDLKSYRPRVAGSTISAIKMAIERQGYDIQSAAYHRALDAARALYLSGELQVHGTPPSDTFVDQLLTGPADDLRWLWVMVKASSAPQVSVLEFPKHLMVFEAADRDVETAIDQFIMLRDKFGIDKPWRPEEEVIILDDTDFRPSFGAYR